MSGIGFEKPNFFWIRGDFEVKQQTYHDQVIVRFNGYEDSYEFVRICFAGGVKDDGDNVWIMGMVRSYDCYGVVLGEKIRNYKGATGLLAKLGLKDLFDTNLQGGAKNMLQVGSGKKKKRKKVGLKKK